ncbi:MAG TPA: helix-turn-helix domain-containing protein [Devosia sp.]|nr:helix-turn-helix domain-containing protein [Devosia sp.]
MTIDKLLNTAEAAETIGLASSTLEKMRVTGAGPKHVKLGRRVLYRLDDLIEWVGARVRQSTSEVTK